MKSLSPAIALHLAGYRNNLCAMVDPAFKASPSPSTIAMAWAMALAFDAAWAVGLYNYDGEMGVTPPPPLWSVVLASTVVASILVSIAWTMWRFAGRRKWPFWLALVGCFAAKGCFVAGVGILSLKLFGPAPFTSGSFYRDAAISIATALMSGSIIGLIVRAVDKSKCARISLINDRFG